MTTTHHTKVLKQIKNKPGKYAKYLKYNVPKDRKYGASTKHCQICGVTHAHVGRYGIKLCRKCFRDYATDLGFKQYH